MRASRIFLKQPKNFWAYVRTISEKVGYTDNGKVKIISLDEMSDGLKGLGLSELELFDNGHPSLLGKSLLIYFKYRANILNLYVKSRLMNSVQAKNEFDRLCRELKPKCSLPMNKQKGAKKQPAFLTGIINMIIESNSIGHKCNYDPRFLTSFTKEKAPLRTLARRVDGAFPSVVDPIAVWEVKEYYYTTTFGSRVADGVYETLLDGMELEELRLNEDRICKHYLMVDAYYTWWDCGKSYLCRIIDMLNMGYLDEVLFGHEVIERLPDIVKKWIDITDKKRL